ncbi:flagella basal body P-ring formation protein FlgA [Novosphingobium sp. 9]|uniref:flagella basal body P-ring formation protein FlgA n=1 Tax=Novosphingobium sp. 9 TaxID=2025349 RepID=UPI0021B5CB6D|nr:flagella basal body P-ring formation protein FlgA [Novosphingobium sp. 9]
MFAASVLVAPVLASVALLASATGFADLDAVDRQVAAFTGAPVGQPGGAAAPVDRRLRLQPCRAGLALAWRTAGHDSVVVQCGDPNGWRLFVPVRQSPQMVAAQAPNAVTRGDAVAIAVTGEGFSVSQSGQAMESGPVGSWIQVRPTAGGIARAEPMRGQIVRPGLVEVPLP